jgi:1-pyrroline-5-carboxylate dehydrogenase
VKWMLLWNWLRLLYVSSHSECMSLDPELVTKVILSHPDFAGLHYTGSSQVCVFVSFVSTKWNWIFSYSCMFQVFRNLWKSIGQNIDIYKNFPRVVGETGGKDFVVAHSSADIDALVTALVRG